ncbi:hypothetical protein ACFWOG_34475 [Kitasatospora sp. NPDC058406]|uniref:hypothetical protein n=1 Tax=Kitasatospora sp. NPDC058406 TaxID=3346483 RepID=UPI00365E7E63
MRAVLDGELRGVYENRRTKVASYPREWLVTRRAHLSPSTYAGYVAWVKRDLIPAFGHIRLLDLRPHHVDEWIAAQLGAGRGRVHAARRRLLLAAALPRSSTPSRQSPAPPSVPAGLRKRPRASCGTTPSSTPTSSPTCSRSSLVPASAAKRSSPCTGRTSTSWTAGSSSAGRSPPSTTTSWPSAGPRPRPAAPGSASPSGTGISGPRRPTAYYRFLGLRT